LRRIEEKKEKEEEKMYERDWRTGHFFRGKILKGSNVKIVKSGLSFLLFSFLIFIFISYFLFLEL